ncbi:hypothetical protein MP228_012660 [Amoeboaphelidium protococcarum]|nr:hypothetical protein MP228_012660 [Amoeboaphelidium protococcarum]
MDFLQQQQQVIVKILSANSPSHNALAACGLVTIVPLLLVMLLPAKLPKIVMTILVGFAVGTLLGDIFLHVIPFVMEQHSEHGHEHHDHSSHHHHTDNHHHHHDSKQESHSHNHAHTIGPMLAILAGLICFMIVDKLIRTVSGGHHHHHHHHQEDHSSHSTQDTTQDHNAAVQSVDLQKKASTSSLKATKVNVTELRKRKAESSSSAQSQDKALNGPPSHGHHHDYHRQSSAGYLSILSSMAHTFTDGLTLSISHYASPSIAASTTFAIFLHEIPHKVSDYAILIQSGFSKPVAVLMQMWSAMGTVLGVLFGIWIQGEQAASVLAGFEKSVIPFSAGGLIYTATVAILPELLEASDVSIFEFMLQICSMCSGIYLMALIALNE